MLNIKYSYYLIKGLLKYKSDYSVYSNTLIDSFFPHYCDDNRIYEYLYELILKYRLLGYAYIVLYNLVNYKTLTLEDLNMCKASYYETLIEEYTYKYNNIQNISKYTNVFEWTK